MRQSATLDHPVVLFDGDCGFCNASVMWLIRRDRRVLLRFAPLMSGAAKDLLAARGITSAESLGDTMVLIDHRGVHTRSTAALRIGQQLGQPWRTLAAIGLTLPRVLRDSIYRLIARHRTRLAGSSACAVPTADIRERFLADPD
jgi:predicted DCC family thiol-disulfide oxidoreductase YuxK